jgi:hypothetical protein
VQLNEHGGGGHSDMGYGAMVAVTNHGANPNEWRVWDLTSPELDNTVAYHGREYGAPAPNHISFSHARPDVPLSDQYACGSGASKNILPLANEVGMDLIYFGIIIIKLLEIGLVTPPVGLNVYVIKGALGNLVSLPTIFRGVGWFVAVDCVTLFLLISFPIISLWLPSLMR